MTLRAVRRTLLQLVLILTSAGLLFPGSPSNSDAGEFEARALQSLVTEYLDTGDGEQAATLLTDILRQPGADVASVEGIIRAGRPYTIQPTGSQPGLPVRIGDRRYRYALYVPHTYEPIRDYALVICLHGAGFTGDAYLDRWQARLGENYILACPTIPEGAWWTREAADLILATLREMQNRYRVDPDRIFLTGMSNGGIGAYLVGSHYAPIFAGLAPMAGGLDTVLLPFLQNLRHTPVYIIHGVHDQVMPVELSRSIAGELKRLDSPFIYREHTHTHPVAGGHFFPREELPDLVTWFGSLRRDPLPTHLTVVRDATHLTRFSWVRIDATDRIAAFSDRLTDSRDDSATHGVYARLDVRIVAPNRIDVQAQHVRRYSVYLNQALVDFSKPVTVVTNGRVSYDGQVTPRLETLLSEARARHDRQTRFPASLTIAVDDGS